MPLHPITQQLLKYLQKTKTDYSIINNYTRLIGQQGTREDALLLLDYFHQEPSYKNTSLLEPLFAFGHPTDAQKLVDTCFDKGVIKENYPIEILHLLGYLGSQSSIDILLKHAFDSHDYHTSKEAILGLLHLDCSAHETTILAAVEACYNKPLFDEFVPALTCKLSNQYDILSHFYKLGSTTVSVDCNAGIVLAFSLCGKTGHDFFIKALWNEYWECCDMGTGTNYWAYIGMQNLGIRFSDLYEMIKKTQEKALLRYQLNVFASLLEKRLMDSLHPFRFTQTQPASFLDLFESLYLWEDPNSSNNIVDLARTVDLADSFYRLRDLLDCRIREEISAYSNLT